MSSAAVTSADAGAEAELRRWIDELIAARWRGARAGRVVMLKGDASNRRFWRVVLEPRPRRAPASAIAVDLGPDDLPAYVRALSLVPAPPSEPPFLNVQRFLKSIGAAVPEIYAAAAERRMLLVEDVGELSLFDAALRRLDKPAALYRAAVDELLLIHVEGTRRLDNRCIAASITYDERLFRWEMEQFLEAGAASFGRTIDAHALAPELDQLAARLGRIPRVLSHRDYHGHNLFLQSGRVRVIDFQDALLAPAAQDLAVLLTTRDTDRVIDLAAETRLLDYYMAGLTRRGAPCPEAGEFREGYRLCVLQHALKVIGRFNVLERQGKSGYAAFIPHAVGQARRMLAHHREFPRLRATFEAA
ncbi:MAG TPA: phosphotransferase [Candidatus Binataceae bacterium]|nr:phosphotransferase [Candidatus Binataceae bacterium]